MLTDTNDARIRIDLTDRTRRFIAAVIIATTECLIDVDEGIFRLTRVLSCFLGSVFAQRLREFTIVAVGYGGARRVERRYCCEILFVSTMGN